MFYGFGHVILCICSAVLDSDEETSEKSTDEDQQRSALEELTDIHFKFEVKEVCLFLWSEISSSREYHPSGTDQWLLCIQVLLELTRQADQEKTVLSFSICQLGAEGKTRSFDMSVTSYLRRVALDYCDVPGNEWAEGIFKCVFILIYLGSFSISFQPPAEVSLFSV